MLFILKVFWIFPIHKNRVFFASYKGTQYSCNPKYISSYLEKEKDLDLIWALPKKGIIKSQKIKTVNLLSLKAMYYCLSAKIVIDNVGFFPYIPYRKEQFCINTWHGGGAYKKVDNHTLKKSFFKIQMDKHKASVTNLFMLSCRESKLVANSLLLQEGVNYIESGMPRNDIFFSEKEMEQAECTCKQQLKVSFDEGILLYAPTFRGEEKGKDLFCIEFDILTILRIVEKKYNRKFRFVMRAHHYLRGRVKANYPDIIDASDYPDVIELLCATDILITDYSSIMWDFALTKRPCFIFTPDLKNYLEERNFYIDIRKWKFPISESKEKLYRQIEMMTDSEASSNAIQHHNLFGSYERGQACNELWAIIKTQMQK